MEVETHYKIVQVLKNIFKVSAVFWILIICCSMTLKSAGLGMNFALVSLGLLKLVELYENETFEIVYGE